MRALIPSLLLAFVCNSASAEKFTIDPAHTGVNFTVAHLVVSKVKGRFDKVEGNFDFDEKSQKLDNVMVKIAADSVNTNQADRDKDLRSDGFLDVKKFPEITFKGTKTIYEMAKPKKVEGDLTIHGVTKHVTLDVDYRGAVTDPWGNRRIGFEASTKINRKDFGLQYNKVMETGGVIVGDEVKIEIDGEAIIPGKKK